MKKELKELKMSWYKLSTIYAQTAEEFGMNPVEFKIYHIIFMLVDDCTQRKIIEFTCFLKQTVNNVIKKFEKEGLIKLIVDEHDKRIKKVKLTEKGLNLWDNKFDKLIKKEEEALNCFSKDEIASYIKFITTYENILEEKLKK